MTEDGVWKEWPNCRQCGRRRQTICPTCGVAGNQFLMADYQAAGAPHHGTRPTQSQGAYSTEAPPLVLLVCPRCDEAFSPQFYRLCPACGCAAAEGIETEDQSREPLSNRVLLTAYGLVAVTTLIVLYFWFLFRHT